MHNTVRSAPTIPVRAPSSIANSAPTSTPTHSKHHDHNYTAERSTRESPEKNNTTNTTSARDHHSIPPRPQRSSTETKSDHGRLAIVSGRDSSRTLMTNYPQTDSQDIQTVISPDNEKDTTARTSPNKGKNDYDDDDDKNETASHNVDNEVDSHDKPAPQSQNKSNDLSDFRKSVLSMPEVNFASSTSKDDETFPSPSSSPKQSKAAPPAVAVVQTRTRRLGGQIENKIQQKRSIMNDSISDWDADDDDIDDKDDDGEEEINATSNHQHSTSRGMPSVFNNESSVHGIALAEEGSDWDESEEEQVGTTGAKRSMEARATNLSISNDHRSNGHDSESDVGELNISDFVQNTGGDLHLSSGSESDSDTEDTNRGGGLRSTGHRRLGGARTTSNDSSWLYWLIALTVTVRRSCVSERMTSVEEEIKILLC